MWWLLAAFMAALVAASFWMFGLWAIAGWLVITVVARVVVRGPAVKDIDDQILIGC